MELAGRGLIQGKKIPQSSEECSVALVRGNRCRIAEAAQHGQTMDARTRYKGTGINTPERILRRGAVEAIMGPWVIGAAGCGVSRTTVELSERPCSVCSSRDQQGRKIGASESRLEPRVPAPPLPKWLGLNNSLLVFLRTCSRGDLFAEGDVTIVMGC